MILLVRAGQAGGRATEETREMIAPGDARRCPHCGRPSTHFKTCLERRLYKSEWSRRDYARRKAAKKGATG